jgi:hypothetical protein
MAISLQHCQDKDTRSADPGCLYLYTASPHRGKVWRFGMYRSIPDAEGILIADPPQMALFQSAHRQRWTRSENDPGFDPCARRGAKEPLHGTGGITPTRPKGHTSGFSPLM